ncbi:MAG: hypothetical protein H0V29_09125 [Thermoleophilaceae bacterium]|nr:hypothetical protein [Thermoleophilaceae bacterium]
MLRALAAGLVVGAGALVLGRPLPFPLDIAPALVLAGIAMKLTDRTAPLATGVVIGAVGLIVAESLR